MYAPDIRYWIAKLVPKLRLCTSLLWYILLFHMIVAGLVSVWDLQARHAWATLLRVRAAAPD